MNDGLLPPESPAISALRARFQPQDFETLKNRVIDNGGQLLAALDRHGPIVTADIHEAAASMAELYLAKLNDQKKLFQQILDATDELSLRILNKQFLAYGRVMVNVARVAGVSFKGESITPFLDFDLYPRVQATS